MAIDPKKWTVKTQEAFAAAIDQAKAHSATPSSPPTTCSRARRPGRHDRGPAVLAKLGQSPLMVRDRGPRGGREAAEGATAATSRA